MLCCDAACLPLLASTSLHYITSFIQDVLSRPQAQTTQALASSGQAAFLSTLDQNPECGPVAFYLFPQLFSALDAPVWVDVRPSIVGPPSTQALSSSQRGHCATVLSRSAGDAAGAKQIKYSRHKGTRASSRLFW